MVSASKAQKQTLNVQCCLNPSAHSIFFIQILDNINVAEADTVPWQRKASYFKKLRCQKKGFVLKFLQLKRREIAPSHHTVSGTGLSECVYWGNLCEHFSEAISSWGSSCRPSLSGTAFGSCRAVTAPVWGEAAPHPLWVRWRKAAAQALTSPPSLAQPIPPPSVRSGCKGRELPWRRWDRPWHSS